MKNLTTVVGDQITQDGVMPVNVGQVLCAEIREGLRRVLKTYDPEGYALYRATKYPAGEGSETTETCQAATRILFDRTRDLLVPFYLTTKAPDAPTAVCGVDGDMDDEDEAAANDHEAEAFAEDGLLDGAEE